MVRNVVKGFDPSKPLFLTKKGLNNLKYLTVTEIAAQWEISTVRVREYCRDGRIPKAIRRNRNWLIPEDAEKPGLPPAEEAPVPDMVKRILYQKVRNNHFGLYEYLQVNLAYSSCRMASNRLTRTQVLDLYRTGKLGHNFENTKVDDIIDVVNHFIACAHVLDTVMKPLSLDYIRNIHRDLTYGTYADRTNRCEAGTFRMRAPMAHVTGATKPERISLELDRLIRGYEKLKPNLEGVLSFHVAFEEIRPFADYNGRVGRLILMKECLRYGIDLFIFDDKHRREYNQGIDMWDENPLILTNAVLEAQERFRNQMDTCRLFEYHRTQNPRKLL